MRKHTAMKPEPTEVERLVALVVPLRRELDVAKDNEVLAQERLREAQEEVADLRHRGNTLSGDAFSEFWAD